MKCKYFKKCKDYETTSNTCNLDGGKYYGMNGYAGCYRRMERR